MSVIQSKRKESELEFLKLLRDIEAIFIRMSVNKPRKFKHILDKMIDMSMEALNYAKTANSIYVENQLQFDTRQTYFKQSIAKVYAISSQIEILNIKINEKKLKVTKLKNTFVFLKKRITLTETGKVYMKLGKESITRARRKLKKLFKLYREGRIREQDIYTSFRSWYGMSKKYDNYYASKNYMELFKNLRKEHMNGQRSSQSNQ